jgi:serine protease Do
LVKRLERAYIHCETGVPVSPKEDRKTTMMKRKEFMLGAVAGLAIAAAATAGGVIDMARRPCRAPSPASAAVCRPAGAAGLAFAPPQGAPLSFADIFAAGRSGGGADRRQDPVERPPARAGLPDSGHAWPPDPAGGRQEGEIGANAEGGATLPKGAGSGFFISRHGFIVTNNHVVADAQRSRSSWPTAATLDARLVGRDENTDLAVIKVDGDDFPFVSFEEQASPASATGSSRSAIRSVWAARPRPASSRPAAAIIRTVPRPMSTICRSTPPSTGATRAARPSTSTAASSA